MNRIMKSLTVALLLIASPLLASDGRDQATASGQSLEAAIEGQFESAGLSVIKASDWDESRLYSENGLKLVVRDAPYTSIYGHRARIEFYLILPAQHFYIEAKRQRSSGSTDEKLPYVVANARANISEGRGFVLVIDGDGWKQGAIEWVKDQAQIIDGFIVLDADELGPWLEGVMATNG